jgi:hypothetical protein
LLLNFHWHNWLEILLIIVESFQEPLVVEVSIVAVFVSLTLFFAPLDFSRRIYVVLVSSVILSDRVSSWNCIPLAIIDYKLKKLTNSDLYIRLEAIEFRIIDTSDFFHPWSFWELSKHLNLVLLLDPLVLMHRL